MARTYTNSLAESASEFPTVYTPVESLNKGSYDPITEPFTVPATPDSEGRYRVQLDYAINSNVTPVIDCGSDSDLPRIPYPAVPGPGDVGVAVKDVPILEFHASRAGETGSIEYAPLATVRTADWENRIQNELVATQEAVILAGGGSVVLTDKGDVLSHNGTTQVRVPVGTDGQVLTADSGEAAGVKWEDAAGGGDVLTTKGDVRVHDGTAETRLPAGANDRFLMTDSLTPTGLRWEPTTTLAHLGDDQTFTGVNTFEAQILAGGVDSELFTGNGSGITDLDASALATGTIPDARFPAVLPAVSGAQLTNVGGIRGAYNIENGNSFTPLSLTDECEGGSIPAGWTVVNGSSGTVNMLGTVTGAKYDRTTRAKGMLVQTDNNATLTSAALILRSAVIGSGEQLIISFSLPTVPSGTANRSVAHIDIGDNATLFSGTRFSMYAEVGGIGYYDGSSTFTRMQSGINYGARNYYRVVRSSNDYHFYFSGDGTTWCPIGTKTQSGMSYLFFLFGSNNFTRVGTGDPISCINWIRHTAYTGVDPW